MTACTGRDQGRGKTKAENLRLRKKLQKSEKAEKAPEDYTGTVVVYSPHDADPLNAGVNLFMEKYPNVKVEVVAAGTGELCNRIAASPLTRSLMYSGAAAVLTPGSI